MMFHVKHCRYCPENRFTGNNRPANKKHVFASFKEKSARRALFFLHFR
ncbi:MAG: hypothetical protein IJT76_03025 [Clostridia bacterium]|nr:hypothetical protein [Clostridia bacterium]